MGLKERIENHLGLVIGGFVVAGFMSGFAAYKAILEAVDRDVVPAGTYLSKEECRDQAALGFSHEKLAARLLDLLQPTSEEDLVKTTLGGNCAGPFVRPEAKVEILAYLNAGEEVLRRKAVLAYGNCASGLNEAFLLARTIKPSETSATFDAYALALSSIIHDYGDPMSMEHMKNYLLEIGAPPGLLAAFLRQAPTLDPAQGKVSMPHSPGDNQGEPNPSAPPDGQRTDVRRPPVNF